MSKIIVIAGMHRSGTSLTANWLKENGLFVGDNLMSGKFDNVKGHFEDFKILNIHENALEKLGLKSDGLNLSSVSRFFLDESMIQKIEQLINSRKDKKIWGWKEPRGTLFLNDWIKQNNDLFCLAVYRNYKNVTDSLLRRYKYRLYKTRNIKFVRRKVKQLIFPFLYSSIKNIFLKTWIVYNEQILNFKEKYPSQCIILEIGTLKKKDFEVLDILKTQTGFLHKNISLSEIFEKEQMNEQKIQIHFKKELEIKAEKIMKRLNKNSIK